MDRPLRGALYVRRSLSPNLPLTSASPPSLIRSTENYPIPSASTTPVLLPGPEGGVSGDNQGGNFT